jgi:hypothetical protein
MSIEVIGKEVLPNLYIKSIQLLNDGAEITVAVFDYMDEDAKVTWMSTEFVRNPKIKMNCITTREGNNIDQIFNSSNDYNLYNVIKNIPNTSDIDSTTQNFQSVDLISFDSVIAEKLSGATPNSYIEINHTFIINFDDLESFDSMICYCFFSLDLTKEEDAFFIDATGEDKVLLNGPIFSEIIISNGSINVETSLSTIGGSGYSGPVHFHNNRYMEGSFHEAEMHRFVDVETIRNTKIFSNKNSNPESNDLLTPKNLASTTNTVNSFFGNVSIAVGDKKIYGFFKFKMDEFFRSNPLYNYFVNSFASFNIFKIRDKIRMKFVGPTLSENTEIKEIIINSIETNDMFFYFERPFEEYTETSINIRFEILNINSMFVHTLHLIRVRASNSQSNISTILNTQSGDIITITDPNTILDYAKNYCTLISMLYDVDIENLRTEVLNSIYKNKIPRSVLKKYDDHFLSMISDLTYVVENNPSSMQPVEYTEEKEQIVMQLQNYRNSLVYFDSSQNIVIHPDIISNALINTNKAAANKEALFGNLEQILLPRFIRKNDGSLHTIDYNDITLNDTYLNVFDPTESVPLESEGPIDFDKSVPKTVETVTNKPEVDENSPGFQAQQYIG